VSAFDNNNQCLSAFDNWYWLGRQLLPFFATRFDAAGQQSAKAYVLFSARMDAVEQRKSRRGLLLLLLGTNKLILHPLLHQERGYALGRRTKACVLFSARLDAADQRRCRRAVLLLLGSNMPILQLCSTKRRAALRDGEHISF
jgi:hypothetical protein